jgi:hypothetical protein
MADLRFCAYQYQHLSLDALRRRWRDAEGRGFDVLWNCDTGENTQASPEQAGSSNRGAILYVTFYPATMRRVSGGTRRYEPPAPAGN